MPRFLLWWAAVPALALGAWLIYVGGAPRAALTLHISVALVAALVCAGAIGMRRPKATEHAEWLALALAVSLFLPLFADSTGAPQRWLVVGGARLYLAPVVLPLILFVLGAPWRALAIGATALAAAAVALMLQPDAAQSTAFALATLVILAGSDLHRTLRLALAAVVVCAMVVAWRTPDPLAPVRYVEGVFVIAAEVSPVALAVAVCVATLPVAALLRVARVTGSRGAYAAAAYFAGLFALAPLQITPVPLLGFGTGPVVGYFLVAVAASRLQGQR